MTGSHSRGCPSEEQVVAWVLRAAEPGEEAEVERHLSTCASCRALVRETEETLAVLGGAVEADEPPPHLRDRILDAAAQTPQERPAPRPSAPTPRGAGETGDTGRAAGTAPSGGAGSGPGRGGRPGGRRGVRGRVVG
ncbi:zf-HC2 domain-containing protein, partial [Pseudonocardia kujensis]|uniref:zf-HC2 domain-containing protein n=1 Tax=Pseudonocardia kujensis TaxID=1128675 RepID=UPI001E629FCD